MKDKTIEENYRKNNFFSSFSSLLLILEKNANYDIFIYEKVLNMQLLHMKILTPRPFMQFSVLMTV